MAHTVSDAVSGSIATPATPLSVSFTVPAGSGLKLFMFCMQELSSTADFVNDPTYNGVALTLAKFQNAAVSANLCGALYYMDAPPAGAHTLAWDANHGAPARAAYHVWVSAGLATGGPNTTAVGQQVASVSTSSLSISSVPASSAMIDGIVGNLHTTASITQTQSGQTAILNAAIVIGSDGVVAGTSWRDASAGGTVAMSWTFATSQTRAAHLSTSWALGASLTSVSSDLACTYAVTGSISSDLAGTYGIVGSIDSDLAGTYSVGSSLTSVSSDFAGTYGVVGSISSDMAGTYAVVGSISSDLAATYSINSWAITQTELIASRIYQRVAGVAPIALAGTYSGGTPTGFEARIISAVDGTTVVQNWTALTGVSAAAGNWSGTLSAPQGGFYQVQTRVSDGGGVQATSTLATNTWAVGALFLCIGSSTAARWFNDGAYTGEPQSRKYTAGSTTWLTWADGPSVHFATQMVSELGVPVGMISCGVGSTYLQGDWEGESGNFSAVITALNNVGNKVEAVICHVGSNDARNGTINNKAGFLTSWRSLIANCRTRTTLSTVPFFIWGCQRSASGTAANWNIAHEVEAELSGDANVYLGCTVIDLALSGDAIHLSTAAMVTAMTRMELAVHDVINGGTYHRGPAITNFRWASDYAVVDLAHFGGTDFTPTSGITGFAGSDSSGALTISSAVRDAANRIRLTFNRAVASSPVFTYQNGGNPTISAPAFDNSAAVLPLQPSTTITAEALLSVSSDLAGTYTLLSGTTSVSSDLACTYNVASSVDSNLAATYAIISAVSADLAAVYELMSASSVSSDLAATYAIAAAISSDLAASYALGSAVNSDLSSSYLITSAVSGDLAGAFAVSGLVNSDLAGTFAVTGAVSSDLAGTYTVDSVLQSVSNDLSAAYAVIASLNSELQATFAIQSLVSADLSAAYQLGLVVIASRMRYTIPAVDRTYTI